MYLIRRVLAVSSKQKRRDLLFTYAPTLLLYYGDGRFPSGIIPPGANPGGASAFTDGKPVPVSESYHVIGGACNEYYNASIHEIFAAPGCAACAGFHASRADAIVRGSLRIP